MTLFITRCILLLIAAHPVAAPGVDPDIISDIKDGLSVRQKGYRDRLIEVAHPSIFVGGDCSAEHPCWPLVQRALDVTGADGSKLHSVKARDLLSSLVHGKGVSWLHKDHLLLESLLLVLWAVDPQSYFFAYVDNGKLVAVMPPARMSAARYLIHAAHA